MNPKLIEANETYSLPPSIYELNIITCSYFLKLRESTKDIALGDVTSSIWIVTL